MFERAPVTKLSTHNTSPPSSSKRSHRCDPINPAPPVTRVRFKFEFPADPQLYRRRWIQQLKFRMCR